MKQRRFTDQQAEFAPMSPIGGGFMHVRERACFLDVFDRGMAGSQKPYKTSDFRKLPARKLMNMGQCWGRFGFWATSKSLHRSYLSNCDFLTLIISGLKVRVLRGALTHGPRLMNMWHTITRNGRITGSETNVQSDRAKVFSASRLFSVERGSAGCCVNTTGEPLEACP